MTVEYEEAKPIPCVASVVGERLLVPTLGVALPQTREDAQELLTTIWRQVVMADVAVWCSSRVWAERVALDLARSGGEYRASDDRVTVKREAVSVVFFHGDHTNRICGRRYGLSVIVDEEFPAGEGYQMALRAAT